MSMRRHRRSLRPVAEINMTSLLDVSFVLLISFMLVAPSLKYGIELDLPAISQGAPHLATEQEKVTTITVPKSGAAGQEYFINETSVSLDALEQQLRDRQTIAGGKLPVEVQADREVSYETFVQVMAAVRRAGIESVGLPVEAGSVAPPVVDPSGGAREVIR